MDYGQSHYKLLPKCKATAPTVWASLCFFPGRDKILPQKQAAKWNTKPLYAQLHSVHVTDLATQECSSF